MKQSDNEIELNHKAIDLYNIVLDIEKYPDYIPWCSKTEILKRKKNEISANMIVDYKFIPSQIFTSNVIFDLEKLFIKTKYIKGPLKDLDTLWKFIDIKKNKSKVLFTIEFEFKNFFHQKFAELFFPLVENKMIDSFIKRADEILD
jgi:coenzyme Q-binding protein COQ10